MAEVFATIQSVDACISVFKEVFLVAKFMYKTAISAKNHVKERVEAQEDFRHQVLLLQSLGIIYFSPRGILLNNRNLNQAWLDDAKRILERIRRSCLDYAKAAEEDDVDYRLFSPFLNQSEVCKPGIEFPLHDALPEPCSVRTQKISTRALRWLGLLAQRSNERLNEKFNEGVVSMKWALYEKDRFRHVVQRFRELNAELKEILPFVCLTEVAYLQSPLVPVNGSAQSSSQQTTEHTKRLGLLPHSEVQHSIGKIGPENRVLQDVSIRPRPSSNRHAITVGELVSTKQTQTASRVLLEYKPYFPSSAQNRQQKLGLDDGLRSLANVLAVSGHHRLLTLPFKGIVDDAEKHRAIFVFDFPETCDAARSPKTLYELIKKSSTSSRFDLLQRFQVARKISESLCSFHNDGWVHKSMRSESICFFRKAPQQGGDSALDTSSPYLVNFEFSRPLHAATRWDYDDDVERNLYRHPKRQGYPSEDFKKIHDIYALGVVLLEIGLWQTAAHIADLRDGDPVNERVQEIFIANAKTRLDHYMGKSYREAVVTCLSGELQQAYDNLKAAEFAMMFRQEVVKKIQLVAGVVEIDDE